MPGFSRGAAALIIAFAIPFCAARAGADSEHVFFAFAKNGSHDGFRPSGALIADKDGNLYGVTIGGGVSGVGTVFKLTPGGQETILHSFAGDHDGSQPIAGLLMDEVGNLYGTTSLGGDSNAGTVFRIAPNGTETVLYAFKGGSDGRAPEAELIADESGNVFGTTAAGGSSDMGTSASSWRQTAPRPCFTALRAETTTVQRRRLDCR